MEWLGQAKQADLPGFMVALADFMRNGAAPQESRQQAGLQLKNCLYSKDVRQQMHLQDCWRNIRAEQRMHIKNAALETLGTESTTKSTAAQVIASIAEAEIPYGLWPDVIQTLLQRLNPQQPDPAKVASLEAIGYICEVVEPEHIEQYSDFILTGVISSMRKEEPNLAIVRAAVTALLNSLEFTKKNFNNENERNAIMTSICETTLSSDVEVKVGALECLVKTMSLYYEHMQGYMQALYGITLQAINADSSDSEGEKVVLQGIEFWNTVCEKELDIMEQIEIHGGGADGAVAATTAGHPVFQMYAKGAHLDLLPILLRIMITPSETEDEDDPDLWSPSKAATLCVELYANVCREKVLPIVMTFSESNLRAAQWQQRDAAVLAFAAVLKHDPPVEQEKKVALINYTAEAVPHVVVLMRDPSVAVRDSVAYLIGQILKETPEAVIQTPSRPAVPSEYLLEVCKALHGALQDSPRVATQACWAINNLAEACYNLEAPANSGGSRATSQLSPFLPDLVRALFGAAASTNEKNLRLATFEALYELIRYSPENCYESVIQSTTESLSRLEASLLQSASMASPEALMALADTQSSFLSLLQACIDVLQPKDVAQISDRIMEVLLKLLADTPTGKTSAVKEDAMLTVSRLVTSLGPSSEKYVQHLLGHVINGLQNVDEHQVCQACVGVAGDLARELEGKILAYCDQLMASLLRAVQDERLNRDVKSGILAVFADIAMGIGDNFKKYYESTAQTLQEAAQITMIDTSTCDDYDEIDFYNGLREGCLDGYAGILHGLKGPNDAAPNPAVQLLQSQVQFIVQFISVISRDEELSDSNIRSALGLLGDLCTVFGTMMLPILPQDFCNHIVSLGMRSNDPQTHSVTQFAQSKFASIRGH